MQFSDLVFLPHPRRRGGVRATTFFPNGYGASIIKSQYSYGGPEGLYELAVLKGDENTYRLCFDTSVTNAAEGWLTPERVTELLKEIEAL